MAHISRFLILLITISAVSPETISTTTPDSPTASFGNIDIAQLLQSLNMTQTDLDNLRNSVVNSNPATTPASATTQSSSASNAPVSPSSADANKGNGAATASPAATNNSPTPSSTQGSDAFQLADLSALQKQLGLSPSSSAQTVTPSSSAPATSSTNSATNKPVGSQSSSAGVPPAGKNALPTANTIQTQQSAQTATTSPNQVVQSSSQSVQTNTDNSYDFLGQYNALSTSTSISSSLIPLNAPIPTTQNSNSTSQLNSVLGLLDLTDLQQQLGLISKPTNTQTTTAQATTANASTSSTNAAQAQGSNKPAPNSGSQQNKPSVNKTSQGTNNLSQLSSTPSSSPALPPSSSPAVAPSSAPTSASNPNPRITPVVSSPPDAKSSNPSNPSANQNSSSPSSAIINTSSSVSSSTNSTSSDQASLLQNLADLQKLLDQLSSNTNLPANTTKDNKSNTTISPIPQTPNITNLTAQNIQNPSTSSNTSTPSVNASTSTVTTIPTSTQPSSTPASPSPLSNLISQGTNSQNVPALIDISSMTVDYSAYKNNSFFALPSTSVPTKSSNTSTNNNFDSSLAVPTKSEQTQQLQANSQSTQPIQTNYQQNFAAQSTQNTQNNQLDQQTQSQPTYVNNNNQKTLVSASLTYPATSSITLPVNPTSAPAFSLPSPTNSNQQSQIVISRLDPRFYQPNQIQGSTNVQPQSQLLSQPQTSATVPAYTTPQSAANNQNLNNIYIYPSAAIPKTSLPTNTPAADSNPTFIPSNTQQSSFQAYQQVCTSNLAVYTLNASYKQFAPSFVLAINDPFLPSLRSYLSQNYGTYINQGSSLIAGFRGFNNYDDSIDYQLIYKTIYGTFNAILNYNPDNNAIVLKSLSVVNFQILQLDLSNCQIKDDSQSSCKVCSPGYRNFMGRCKQYDSRCLQFITDQCGLCDSTSKSTLSKGVCI